MGAMVCWILFAIANALTYEESSQLAPSPASSPIAPPPTQTRLFVNRPEFTSPSSQSLSRVGILLPRIRQPHTLLISSRPVIRCKWSIRDFPNSRRSRPIFRLFT